MAIINARARSVGRRLRPVIVAATLLALSGCVVGPGGYYGAAPGYPAYAAAYPAYPGYGYYAAPPVGVVVGGGGWGGGWGHGWGGGWGGGGYWHR
jgi:hypothetical protein